MRKFINLFIIFFPIFILVVFPKCTVDDSFIYFRYADNLAKYGELNWNVGESPVEGYTGVAWPVILAGFIKLGLSPIAVSQVLGVLFYFAGVLALFFILKKIKVGFIGQEVGLLMYVTTPILFTHVFSGMETMMFMAMLLLSVYFALCVLDDSRYCSRKSWLFFLILLLLGLTRPEGVALGVLLILAIWFVKRSGNRNDSRHFIRDAILFYFIPAGLYFFWRVGYYGQFLPNTFYAKTGDVGFGLSNEIDLARFLIRYFALPVVACLMLAVVDFDLFWRKIKDGFFCNKGKSLVAVGLAYFVFIILLLLQFTHSHLNMNFAYRFYLPFLPFIWLILSLAIDWGWRILSESKNNCPLRYRFFVILLLLFSAYQLLFHFVKLKAEINFSRDEKISLETQHIAIGKFLKVAIPANEWLSVYMDAGAIPYFSGLKTIDFGRLNDEILARKKMSTAELVDYFYSFNHGVAVFTSENIDRLQYEKTAEAIVNDPRFDNYVLFKKYPSPLVPPENYIEFLYLRKDLIARLK